MATCQQVSQLAQEESDKASSQQIAMRRSQRVSQAIVVPAVQLTPDCNPLGDSFGLFVTDISQEGVGLVSAGKIRSDLIALELSSRRADPIQVAVQIVREHFLSEKFYNYGGEFLARFGDRQ